MWFLGYQCGAYGGHAIAGLFGSSFSLSWHWTCYGWWEQSVNRHKAGEVGRLEIPFDRALNVDACNKGESGLAGAGGLIRDNIRS